MRYLGGMAISSDEAQPSPRPAELFATTHWSVVLAAADEGRPEAAEALETLCRTYWYPLYAFVRRRGHNPEDAEDLTQGFFAHLLEKQALGQLTREGGKFRSFLLTALNHFLTNEWEHQRAQKRDQRRVVVSLDDFDPEARYRLEPVEVIAPEMLFDRQWAATLLNQVLARLRAEQTAEGKGEAFDRLRGCLTGAEASLPYADLAAQLGMTGSAVKMAVHRLRKRYGELLRAEIARTVASPQEVDEEIRHLIAINAG